MAKARPQPDVVVVGSHPACYLAATLLQQEQIPTCHVTLPDDVVTERLVLINPKFFDLHKLTGGLKKSLDLSPIYGLKFLADDAGTQSEFTEKTIGGYVGGFKQIRAAAIEQAQREKVSLVDARSFGIQQVDERGLELAINNNVVRPKALIVGCDLPVEQTKILGLPEMWESGVLHRYTFLKLKGTKWIEPAGKPTLAMSLDLAGKLYWAWLLVGPSDVQLAVEQPIESVGELPPASLLGRWVQILIKRGILKLGSKSLDLEAATSMDLPLAGALSQEGVANRTLLIGPAGGFYTACSEDIYPNCWSAIFAVESLCKAFKERHLQDAIGSFRQTWGSTLGDYLRGPQQNLRFLLPLVYRNSVMTSRMGQAILTGVSVVR